MVGWGTPVALERPSPQTQHQLQRRLLPEVVVRERAPVFELLALKNQTLLVG